MRLIDADKIISRAIENKKIIIEQTQLMETGEFEISALFKDLSDIINNQPIEDAKIIIHGEWKTTDGETFQCSVCETTWKTPYMNFCPYCGADMR